MDKIEIFSSGELGSVCYCSPGAVVAADGSILVFCEARVDAADDGPHHLALKGSTDGGCTWGNLNVLEESNGICYMNPTPVVESESGRMLIFYALADGSKSTQVFVRESMDNGLSWSERMDFTYLFADDPLKRKYHLPGPGHGIQLNDGRLVIPFWHRNPLKRVNNNGEMATVPPQDRKYGTSVIYSDDGGRTWQAGGYVKCFSEDGASYCMNELNIVETDKGLVMLARTMEKCNLPYRYWCISYDRGESWTEPVPAEGLSDTVQCYTGLAKIKENLYLLARPESLEYPRRQLRLNLSDDTYVWRPGKLIESGFGAYNDIVLLPDGRIAVVYVSTHFNNTFGKTIHCAILGSDELQ